MATMQLNEYNFVSFIQKGLEQQVKQAVTDKLISQAVAEFRKKLETELEPMIEQCTMDSIDSVKDLANIRDELKIYVQWSKEG